MELKQAFFILRHGSSEGLPKYLEAVKTIEDNCPPVVRCKKCAHSSTTESGRRYCKEPLGMYGAVPVQDDCFCSHGEAREDEGEGDKT